MTVKEFIEEYKGDADRLEIKTYVSIKDRLKAINAAIIAALEVNGRIAVTYSSVTMEIMRDIILINLYTDLEVSSVEEYDLLSEDDLLETILCYIGKEEYEEFARLWDMRLNDINREQNGIDAIMGRLSSILMGLVNEADPELIKKIAEIIAEK